MKKIYNILSIGISLIILAIIYPFSLQPITPYIPITNDTICFDCNVQPDTLIPFLLTILIPIIILLGITILIFYSIKESEN